MSTINLSNKTATRRCGDCAACCTTHAVDALQKAAGTACSHLRSGTKPCANYDRRPAACRNFTCLWLRGVGEDQHRPDQLGVVFDLAVGSKGTQMVRAMEVRPGAADTGAAAAMVANMGRCGLSTVIIYRGVSKTVVLPDGRRVSREEP